MKIIDFERKGNVVRFYLGEDECEDYHGDDWDDRPYEHNAGKVYDEYIASTKDALFPFDYTVLEPKDPEWQYNSQWCKDDMKERKIPCIIVVPESEYDYLHEYDFMYYLGNEKVKKIYFGDSLQKLYDVLENLNKEEI